MTDSAAYMRRWRQQNPEGYAYNKAANNALRRAQTRLAERYPDELDELLNEERQKVGLPPVGVLSTTPRRPHRKSTRTADA